jgi:HEPN domain-containing protein
LDEQEKFEHWLRLAQYDMDTAEAMLQTQRWIYVVFMCQQAIEKLVKGLYGLYVDFDNIPRIHNIRTLVERFHEKLPLPISEEYNDLFDLLTLYYLNNRYPDYVEQLVDHTKQGNAREIYDRTKEAFAWLLTLKPLTG